MNHHIQWEGIAQKSFHSMGWNCTIFATPLTQIAGITPKTPLNGKASPLAVLSGTPPTSLGSRLLELLQKTHLMVLEARVTQITPKPPFNGFG